ncbi:MAG: ATP-binding protein [Solirubrobacterales bacterium]|nr:ATP-binding protein [Solirubrobacterales bacterium]
MAASSRPSTRCVTPSGPSSPATTPSGWSKRTGTAAQPKCAPSGRGRLSAAPHNATYCPDSRVRYIDKYHLLILDDLCYVRKDQAETSALFELIAARYERRSLLVTANQPFGEWTSVFPDAAMTLAAVDRLVHHATIFELNVESFRRRAAAAKASRRPRRPSDTTRDAEEAPINSDQQTS